MSLGNISKELQEIEKIQADRREIEQKQNDIKRIMSNFAKEVDEFNKD